MIRESGAAICDYCDKIAPAVWWGDRWIAPNTWLYVRVLVGITPLEQKPIMDKIVCQRRCAVRLLRGIDPYRAYHDN
jgi:hypothetical protein